MRRQQSRWSAIDSRLEARFAADWLTIWPEQAPTGLAVSGGPDSLGLMLLAHAVIPGRFRVATVDHGLRQQSALEARYVADICAERGIPHETLAVEIEPGPALQERARDARYTALGKWADRNALPAVVTAHHADDQAETLLMRLSRGAGVRGLAGMRAISPLPGKPDCRLVRPLLRWRRSELAEVLAANGIEPVIDPSNGDQRFERVRMRLMLGSMDALDPLALAASAHHLAEADAALDWAAEACLATVQIHAGSASWSPGPVPRVVALRVLERILAELGSSKPRGSALARWHDRLRVGEIATLAGVRGDGRGAEWRFAAAPRPRALSDCRPVGP